MKFFVDMADVEEISRNAAAGLVAIAGLLVATGALAANETAAPAGASLDELIERFDATAEPDPKGEVSLDAWIEAAGGAREVVVLIEPHGETRLVADPGITITPIGQASVRWLTPLPHRHVDPAREYFEPPAAVRMPFSGEGDLPIELQVEYAYCVIDFQCFFGEERVTVENRIN